MIKNTTFFLVLTITLTASMGWAMEPDPDDSYSQKLKARDAITLGIEELQGLTNFVKLIPQLKILQVTHQTPELDLCVNHMVHDLDAMKSTLHRLRHLKHTNLSSDANSVKRMMAHGENLGKACGKSFRNVDEIVRSMLTRKLGDLSMVISAVVQHVSKMERDIKPAGGDS
ncbi:hypothetical protein CASFOL_007309 [Castilleja foliolosa]|uniref:Pectinesterase inhibitor domain-containing protein n=1 Tax=Castilleja foliolosa TaxID=1961234 RepID=A0ABD3ECP2_9LAMI